MDHQLGEGRGAGGDEKQKQEVNRHRLSEPVMGQQPSARSCARCNSSNTNFCYYNNYSFAQQRYFCKDCRRHWTHGGSLRNIPIRGGSRKSKQPELFFSSANASRSANQYLLSEQQNNTFFYRIATGVCDGLLPFMSAIQSHHFRSNHGAFHWLELPYTKTGQERPNQDAPQSFEQVICQQQNLPVGTTTEMGASSSSNYNWNGSSSSKSNSNDQNDQCNGNFQTSGE